MVEYDYIFYLDLDVDMLGIVPAQVANAVTYLAGRAAQPCAISAGSDWASLVNTGVMLFRPSAAHYREMLALLQTGKFGGSTWNGTGFGMSGTPKSLMNASQLVDFKRRSSDSRMWRHDSWDTIAGDSDQGLFSWYGLRAGVCYGRRIRVSHFWWQWKPFNCKRWVLYAWGKTPFANSTLQEGSACHSKFAKWNKTADDTCRKKKQYI